MSRFSCLAIVLTVTSTILTLITMRDPPGSLSRFIAATVNGALIGASLTKLICFFNIDGK